MAKPSPNNSEWLTRKELIDKALRGAGIGVRAAKSERLKVPPRYHLPAPIENVRVSIFSGEYLRNRDTI